MEISLNSCGTLINRQCCVFCVVGVISRNKRNEYKLKGILDVWNIFDFSIKMNLLLATICLYLKHTFEVLTNSVVI